MDDKKPYDNNPMPRPIISLLHPDEIRAIHEASLKILADTGVRVHNQEIRQRLVEAGLAVNESNLTVCFNEEIIESAINISGKQFCLHGRTPDRKAAFGFGDKNIISSPGQFAWFDHHTRERRSPLLSDVISAGRLGEALENITIVGGMAIPADVPPQARDVVLTATLLKQTGKPVRAFPVSRLSSRYVLEILKTVAGGSQALRERPMTEMLLEPISPLQLPEKELGILLEFLNYGQPISIGPMAMASGTAPATLAGTLAQENAEILAALVIIQTLAPGTPILYGSIPHIMDPRSSICSFGSPEQGLMALALTEVGKSYGFPVYINVNLTDSKRLDAQTGFEKMGSLLLGMIAGADLFGHAGILGPDHGGCLTWLVADDAAVSFSKRILQGMTIDAEHLAVDLIKTVGPGGNYLSEEHTVRHYRKELWLPNRLWTRDTYDLWEQAGSADFESRAIRRVDELLAKSEPPPLETGLEKEIDRIVAAAINELC
jgi:trimethylamine--corrinoid protein Co-methyltransferase